MENKIISNYPALFYMRKNKNGNHKGHENPFQIISRLENGAEIKN